MKPDLTIIRGTQPLAFDPKAIARLARALQAAFNIQSGDRLVLILGSGHEQTNEQALETWVRSMLREHGVMHTTNVLSLLLVELEKCLNRWGLDQ